MDLNLGARKERLEPTPPAREIKNAGHHWLEVLDYDEHSFGIRVLQWNPGAKRWSNSGMVGTGIYISTEGWRYVGPCPMPDLGCPNL